MEPEGPQRAPDISGRQAQVTKLSRQWPFGVAIFAVAQWRDFFSINQLLIKLVLYWQTAQAKTGNLKK